MIVALPSVGAMQTWQRSFENIRTMRRWRNPVQRSSERGISRCSVERGDLLSYGAGWSSRQLW